MITMCSNRKHCAIKLPPKLHCLMDTMHCIHTLKLDYNYALYVQNNALLHASEIALLNRYDASKHYYYYTLSLQNNALFLLYRAHWKWETAIN